MLVRIVGNAQRLALRSNARRFARDLEDPVAAQHRCLQRVLKHCADSAYGTAHGLGKVRTLAEFQDAIPVVSYDTLQPWVERAAAGESGVLSNEPIRAFEPSSGSSAAQKLIPYTPALFSEFQAATSPWIYDLLSGWPALARSKHYWAISPGGPHGRTTSGGTPIGLEDDTEYLGFFARLLTGVMLAVPGEVSKTESIESCRRQTAAHLLACPDLGFISVWSPTFLSLLFEQIDAEYAELRRTCPRQLPGRFEPEAIWPHLALVSCWASGPSARLLEGLTTWIPNTPIQPKGLLATEGVISFPLKDAPGPVLATASHLLEFIDSSGSAKAVHELEEGSTYEPIISTSGGLLRYRLGDQIRVVGRHKSTPCVDFVGRADGVSDLCGEKLSEGFVDASLAAVGAKGFVLMAPILASPPRYVVWSESALEAERLEAELQKGFHYERCRALGQLDPVVVRRVTNGPARYEAGCIARGMKAGDIKPRALSPLTDWPRWLD